MWPAQFEAMLRDLLLKADGIADAVPVAEADVHRHPYGLVVTYATGARVLLQIVVTAAVGGDHAQAERAVEGEPVPDVPELPEIGPLHLAAVDRHLAALLLASGYREIAAAAAYSSRPEPGAVPYGVRIDCHSGARVHLYVVQAAAADGAGQHRRPFDIPPEV